MIEIISVDDNITECTSVDSKNIHICPSCRSTNIYNYSKDDTVFDPTSNTGHYVAYCKCRDCSLEFANNIEFSYTITAVSYC